MFARYYILVVIVFGIINLTEAFWLWPTIDGSRNW